MKTIKIRKEIERETEKAVKVFGEWLPKSQIEIQDDGILVEDWLLDKFFDGYTLQTALFFAGDREKAHFFKEKDKEIQLRDIDLPVAERKTTAEKAAEFEHFMLEYMNEHKEELKEFFSKVESDNRVVKDYKNFFENIIK